MSETTLKEFLTDPGDYIKRAAQGPVTITKDGEPQCVLLSNEDFARLKRREKRLSEHLHELTPEDVEALENAKYGEIYDPNRTASE